MSALLASMILYILVAHVTSAVVLLPVAALVEAVAPGRAAREFVAWLIALGAPHLTGALAVLYVARLHALDPLEWVERRLHVRHVSFWWIAGSPDAAYRVRFTALIAAGLLAIALVRPVFSALLAWRYGRTLARSSEHVAELDVWLTPLARPWSTSVGFLRTRVYVTTGAVQLMTAPELSTVIAHERAHGARRDNLWLLAAQVFFGPLVLMPTARYAYRRLQAAAERAADQAAAESKAGRQDLAAALVKAARKLRDYSPHPDEDTIGRRLAGRYREEFVAERAQQLLQAAEGDGPPRSRALLSVLSIATLAVLALLIAGAGILGPTIRSLYESLLAALGG